MHPHIAYPLSLTPPAQILDELEATATWFHWSFTTSVNPMDNPWGFDPKKWHVGPKDDPSTASFFLSQLAGWNANFFTVRHQGGLAALAITVRLTADILADGSYQKLRKTASPGHLYFAVYCVDPRHRGHKLASRLIDASIRHGHEQDPKPEMFFVRTHAHHNWVINSFNERGLEQVDQYEQKQFENITPRIVMGAPYARLKTLLSA